MTEQEKSFMVEPGAEFEASAKAKAVDPKAVLEELGVILPHLKPEDVRDRTFEIRKAKVIASDLEGPGRYYFCTCVDPETGEKFTVNLGGMVIVELFDKYYTYGPGKPIKVTLHKTEGTEDRDGYWFVD